MAYTRPANLHHPKLAPHVDVYQNAQVGLVRGTIQRWEPILQASNKVDKLGYLGLAQQVELLMQQLDFELRLRVDRIVILRGATINFRLAVLAHHDNRRGVGCLERQHQVQQDKRVRVPVLDLLRKSGEFFVMKEDLDDQTEAANEGI